MRTDLKYPNLSGMSKRSKPRKTGEYVGGRPWPAVCPSCRHCGGSPPKLFYRARGLCNICYKEVRNTEVIDDYEPLPEVCSDISLRSMLKSPRRWLQKEMGRSHASQFEDGTQVKEEATRVFELAVSRWYGMETPPVIHYEKVSIEEIIWGNQHPDPGPMSIEDAINLKNASKSKIAAKRRNRALIFWKEIGSVAHGVVKTKFPSIRRPRLSCMGDSTTATWGVGQVYLSITSMRGDTFMVLELEDRILAEEDFQLSKLSNILNTAVKFQKANKTG